MGLYFLSYDLRAAKNYEQLYEGLTAFSAIRVLESLWCFNRFNTNAEGLVDYFRGFIDSDDGLSVVEVNDWASYNASGTPHDL